MKVYEIEFDVNHFQSFYLDIESDDDWTDELDEMITCEGLPKLDTWEPPPVFIMDPKLKQGNFYSFESTGALVADSVAVDQLLDLFEMSGELLPLPYKDQTFYLLNVLECVDVLDEDKTVWRTDESTGERLGGNIKNYAFHPGRFVETPIFKIPQRCKTGMFTIEGMKHPDDEFKSRVEKCGLQGLIFEEVWDSEKT